jgi:hypothetical protein
MTALSALRPGGQAVVGTFAEDGPASCSGLPVARYDTQALTDAFGAGFASSALVATSTAPQGIGAVLHLGGDAAAVVVKAPRRVVQQA